VGPGVSIPGPDDRAIPQFSPGTPGPGSQHLQRYHTAMPTCKCFQLIFLSFTPLEQLYFFPFLF